MRRKFYDWEGKEETGRKKKFYLVKGEERGKVGGVVGVPTE